MKKRILLLLLVGAMVATSLAGCGKKETGQSSQEGIEVAGDDYQINLGYYN